MNSTLRLIAVLVCITAGALAQDPIPDPLASTTEIIVVTTSDWNSTLGTLRRYERHTRHDKWKAVTQPIAVTVGKNGLGWGSGVVSLEELMRDAADPDKKEGDGKAPAGIFRLGKAFGYAPQSQAGWKMPYTSLTSAVECVDDSSSRFYNKVVDRGTVSPDWHSSEQMLRSDDLYRWGIVVEHNTDPVVAVRGSCIFMHIWRGPGQPTVGCTAMPQAEIEALLSWLDPSRAPLLVQMPLDRYRSMRKRWHLPEVSKASVDNSSGARGVESRGK